MRLFRAVILSLVVHLILVLLLSRLEPTPLEAKKPETFVELTEAPPRTEDVSKQDKSKSEIDRQIVRSTEVPPELLAQDRQKDREARFLSEKDQTVLEERRAQASGLTANRSGTNPTNEADGSPGKTQTDSTEKNAKKQAEAEPQHKVERPRSRRLDLGPTNPLEKAPRELAEKLPHESQGDIAVGGLDKRSAQRSPDGSRELILPGAPGMNGASTVGEQLPADIKFGNFTALNTDRYLYYSFYARVEELVRHRWVKYVRSTLYSYQNSSKTNGRETWTTQIEIVLDRAGNFQRAILHEGSGLRGLDAAPVQAFREAKQIPNPPQEMVKSDGTIRLMYEFNVNFVPQVASGG